MLKLSRKMLYALEAVVDIAYNARPEPVQSKEITRRQGIPQRYLEQVMQQLVHEGVLKGVRGPKGGYRLARERRRKSAVRGLEHMMALVEDNACGALCVVAAPSCIDHHQCVVGDHKVGLCAVSCRAFDKALPVVRAASINTLSALIGECGDTALSEKGAEPSGQVPADHVAVAGKACPARNQLRKDCGTARKTALQSVF